MWLLKWLQTSSSTSGGAFYTVQTLMVQVTNKVIISTKWPGSLSIGNRNHDNMLEILLQWIYVSISRVALAS